MTESLGIIAAKGILPIMVADNNVNLGGRSFVACLDGFALEADFKNHIAQKFSIGKTSAIIKYFKEHSVTKIVICGAMARPNLSALSVDTKGAILLAKILAAKVLGDDHLLRIVAGYIEAQGFEIVSPINYTKHIPIITKLQPSAQEKNDIKTGFQAASALGIFDIGQSVIVEKGAVLGVEGAEGTDLLIKRCGELRKSNKVSGILVKSMKPTQDPRLDTPVIGVETVRAIKEAGMRGIAVSDVIILKPQEVMQEADRLGVFLVDN